MTRWEGADATQVKRWEGADATQVTRWEVADATQVTRSRVARIPTCYDLQICTTLYILLFGAMIYKYVQHYIYFCSVIYRMLSVDMNGESYRCRTSLIH